MENNFREEINNFVFAADGKHIATGSSDGTLRLFDTQRKELWKLVLEEEIGALAFSSNILLRDEISQKFHESKTRNNVLSLRARAPWHPLAPVSLASLKRNKDNDLRKKFLCQLTLKRLKAADPKIWGKDRLVEDAAFAAEVMAKIGYPELAKEANDFRSPLQSPDEDE